MMNRLLRLLVAFLPAVLAVQSLRAQLSYPDFSNTAGLRLVGVAAVGPGNSVRLTPAQRSKVGAMWCTEQQLVGNGFVTTFSFRLSGMGGLSDGNAPGGDGIAFVIQNESDSAIGFSGGSIGYEGIRKSLAIEFDTWDDGFSFNGDPNGNHLSINTRDTFPNSSDHGYSITSTISIPNLSDGNVHTAVIQYFGKLMSIYIDGCAQPVLQAAVDLDALLKLTEHKAWIGFTAATLSAWENHDILTWKSASVGVLPRDTIEMCAGDTIQLSVPTKTGDCTWSSGERTPSIVVRSAGLYTVNVRENLGCYPLVYTRRALVRTVALDVPVITGDRSLDLCEGESVVLDAGVDAPAYRWSTGERTRTIITSTPGAYSVVVIAPGCQHASKPVSVTVRPRPQPVISALGPTSLCAGDSVTLDAGPGWKSYLWSTGDTTQRIRVGDSMTYSVEVRDTGRCSGSSVPILVRVLRQPQPSIVPNHTPTICEGDSIILAASLGYSNYRWSSGDTGQALVVRRSGSFAVTVYTPEGCNGTSPPITVTVIPPPSPTITADGGTTLCRGDSVTLHAPAGFATYRWSTGATADSIRVGDAGSYSVLVVDTNGCSGSSQAIDVAVGTSLTPIITARGATSFCIGDSVVLDASAGFVEYRWSTGDTTQSILVRATGSFSVAVRSASGCSGSSQAVGVTVFPQPPVPAITENAAVLTCDPAATYQWYRDGVLIAGATQQSCDASVEGSYSVRITDANGCTNSSAPYAVAHATTAVSLPDVTGAPGDHVVIPLRLDASTSLNDRRARAFHAVLSFNASMLVPEGSSPAAIVTGGVSRVVLDGTRTAGMTIGELARLEALVMLGNATETPLTLESFVWTDDGTMADTTSGMFRLTGICTQGGPRLLDAVATAGLKPVRPNPASDHIVLNYSVMERGRTRLMIADARGVIVRTLVDGDVNAGSYELGCDARDLPSGIYTCVLITPTEHLRRQVCVVR